MSDVNGVEQVVADLAEACSYCGFECTGTCVFWRRRGKTREIWRVDRPRLSNLFEQLVTAAGAEGYGKLPMFVRDWNECTGWTGIDNVDGAEVRPDDILKTVDALSDALPEMTDRDKEVLQSLKKFVEEALLIGSSVWVVLD